jgi:hypothetical protein
MLDGVHRRPAHHCFQALEQNVERRVVQPDVVADRPRESAEEWRELCCL